MHPYATDSHERVKVLLGIAALSAVLAWVLAIFLKQFPWWDNFWWIDVPSVFGVYMILLALFDQHGWKWRIIRTLHLVSVPNLNGTWVGTIRSSADAFSKKHNVSVSIKQNWTSICITLQAENSHSFSRIAGVIIDDPTGIVLSYEYQNIPNVDAVRTMHIHFGSARLQLAEHNGRRTLIGSYYSGRDRETQGEMKLQFADGKARAASRTELSVRGVSDE
jgi:hypothetical protein